MRKKIRKAKTGEAGASGAKRSKASFVQNNIHSDKLSAYKQDSMGSEIMKTAVQKESAADRELSRLVSKEVFRSEPNAIKNTNTNKRRYS